MMLLMIKSAYAWQCSVDIPYEPTYYPPGPRGRPGAASGTISLSLKAPALSGVRLHPRNGFFEVVRWTSVNTTVIHMLLVSATQIRISFGTNALVLHYSRTNAYKFSFWAEDWHHLGLH